VSIKQDVLRNITMTSPMVEGQRFDFIKSTLEDARRLIATAKAQRWDVLKWAVALNVGLAGAVIIKSDKPGMSVWWVAVAAAAVAAIGFPVGLRSRARCANRALDWGVGMAFQTDPLPGSTLT
jgi:hypothetical protein